MYTYVPVHHCTCSVYFIFFGITCTMTFQLICWGIYKQIHLNINLPVYFHASLSSSHKDLPVTTATCVHVRRCTHSGPYPFIFILSFRLTTKIYPSTVILFYMSTDVLVPSVYLFNLFLIFLHILCNDLSTDLLGYLPTDPPENKFTCLPSCFSFV